MLELLNFKTSILNPALKLAAPAVLLVGTVYFARARAQYQGELGKVVGRLAVAGAIGCLAYLFRFGADLWFSSLKWGESLGFLAFALANTYAVWPLLVYRRQPA